MTAPRSRSFAILRASFLALRAHPRLLAFPVLSAFASLVFLGFVVGLAVALSSVASSGAELPWSLELFADADRGDSSTRVSVAASVAATYGVALIGAVTSVALSWAAMEAMAGRTFTVTGALRHALSRLSAVAVVTFASAWVRRWLDRDRKRGRGRGLTKSLIGMAWWAATYLVVPVLAREKRGGIDSIVRSARLFRETWTEAFVGRLALGWLVLPVGLLMGIGVGLVVWLDIDHGPTVAALLAVPLGLAGIGLLVLKTLDHVYRSALYVFATEGVVPEPFDDPELHEIWAVPAPSPSQPAGSGEDGDGGDHSGEHS